MLTGHNQENFFLAVDDISRNWLINSVPMGESYVFRFRADKSDFNITDVQGLISLDEAFTNAGKALKVIYCVNVINEANVQFFRIQELINVGVDIIAVEFGNETYAGSLANFDFNLYEQWFTPIKLLVETSYPTLPLLVFLAPRPNESGVLGGRLDHSTFNNAAINYINSHPNVFPVVHIYFNSRECTTPYPVQILFNPNIHYPQIEDFYLATLEDAKNNFSLWDKTLDYISVNIPNKNIYITEWGFDNYGDIKNTLALGDVAFRIWNKYSKDVRIKALLQHNGISMALPGFICPAHRQDIKQEGKNLKRVDYFVYKLFREMTNPAPIFINEIGEYQIPIYLNSVSALDYDNNLEIINATTNLIAGDYIYSSSGATEWMLKESTPTYEISEIVNITNKPYFLGYYTCVFNIKLPINNPPKAIINILGKLEVDSNIQLDGSSSIDDESIIAYKWITSGGITVGNNSIYNVIFHVPGIYSFYLEVMNNKELKNTTSIQFRILSKPITPKKWWCRYPAIVKLFNTLGIDTTLCNI